MQRANFERLRAGLLFTRRLRVHDPFLDLTFISEITFEGERRHRFRRNAFVTGAFFGCCLRRTWRVCPHFCRFASMASAGDDKDFSVERDEEEEVGAKLDENVPAVIDDEDAGTCVDETEAGTCVDEENLPEPGKEEYGAAVVDETEAGTCVDEENLPEPGKEEYGAVVPALLPRYRPLLVSDHFVYYAVGHDVAQSSLSGLLVTPGQDVRRDRAQDAARCLELGHVGYDRRGDQLLTLDTLTDEEKAQLSFFYGGCGDCRHVYTTLYDLARQITEGDERVKRGNRVHFFLNDSSPSILARCSILLVALLDLSRFPADVIRNRNNEEVKMLLTFLHFVFVSPVVPFYVHDRLKSIIHRLLGDPQLYPSLMFANATWVGVKSVLEIWLTVLDSVLPSHRPTKAKHIANYYYEKQARIQTEKRRQRVNAHQRELSKQVQMSGYLDIDRLDAKTKDKLAEMINSTAANLSAFTASNLLPLNVHTDMVFALVHRVLPPPSCMLRYHSPQLQMLHSLTANSQEFKEASRDISIGAARQIARLTAENYDPMRVFQDYVPNVTGWDPAMPDEQKDFFRPPQWSPLNIISRLYSSAVIEPPCTPRATLFDLTCNVWENAAIAAQHLLAEPTSSLKFELMDGDMNSDARTLSLTEKERDIRGLPSRFMRAFVSNVPDYTGMLYPLLDIVPRLLPSPNAFLRWNVMYRGATWHGPDHWLDLMLPIGRRERLRDVFGVSLCMDSQFRTFLWLEQDNPQPLDRAAVGDVLLRVLIAIAFPHSQVAGKRSIFPESMVALMELMAFLIKRRVRKDWVSDAIEEILRGEVAIDNPRPSKNPNDLFEPPTVSPTAFLLELKTMLSIYETTLNLRLDPSLGIPPIQTVRPRDVQWPRDGLSKVKESAGLVLYSDALSGLPIRRMALLQPQDRGEAHFISAFHWDVTFRITTFYLADDDYERMRHRVWNIVLFSSQSYEPLSKPMQLDW